MDRYSILGPRNDQKRIISIWNRELENCKSQYSHQMNRMINIQLLNKYYSYKYDKHNQSLKNIIEYQSYIIKCKQEMIDDINRKRKSLQFENGILLTQKKNELWKLIEKNNEIELQSQLLYEQSKVLGKGRNFDR